MTSTEFTAGIGEGARISSKVLKPPGGGSSDIFGVGGGVLAAGARSGDQSLKDDSTHNRVFGSSELPPPPARSQPLHQSSIFENGNNEAPTPPKQKPRKVFVRRNPITGEETEICLESETDNNVCDNEEVKEQTPDDVPNKPVQTSIRVRNPPGGKSSGIF